jgi:hypothetical protein
MQRVSAIAMHAGVESANLTGLAHLRPGIEQHGVCPREDSRDCAYADGEDRDGDCGESWVLLELSQRKSQILQHRYTF